MDILRFFWGRKTNPLLFVWALLLPGCDWWAAKHYERHGTLVIVDGTTCDVTYSDGRLSGGPGVVGGSGSENTNLHQGVKPK